MRKTLRATLFAAAAACALPAAAETLPPPKIAIVDLDALSQKSLVTHDLDKKVEAAKTAYRQNSKYKYESLQEELRALRVDSANLSAEERDKRQASLEQRIAQGGEKQ